MQSQLLSQLLWLSFVLFSFEHSKFLLLTEINSLNGTEHFISFGIEYELKRNNLIYSTRMGRSTKINEIRKNVFMYIVIITTDRRFYPRFNLHKKINQSCFL